MIKIRLIKNKDYNTGRSVVTQIQRDFCDFVSRLWWDKRLKEDFHQNPCKSQKYFLSLPRHCKLLKVR